VAGERFAVRLSGASAVVEGTGDHGCEYMTGGTVVVLGTGRNFAAGMSGGVAYVYDEDGHFARRCNTSMVTLEKLQTQEEQTGPTVGMHRELHDEVLLKKLIEEHHRWTGSLRSRELLDNWASARARFIKVFPHEYKRVRVQARAAGARRQGRSGRHHEEGAGLLRRRRLIQEPKVIMGKVTGFLEYERIEEGYEPPQVRLKTWKEFVITLAEDQAKVQGARCMDCGTPFCNNGCPVNNIIPDFNDLVFRGDWQNAITVLHQTNNFPEFTGRVCPAPCEAACTLNVNGDAVGIKSIEHAIIDRAWAEGWVQPQPPAVKTGKKVAVVGSGPAGLAAAQQLARAGHAVTVFEKNSRLGGLLRYGIPDFKMEKSHIDRRVAQMQAEGVVFRGRGLSHRRADRRVAGRQQGHQRRQGIPRCRSVEGRVRRRAAGWWQRNQSRPARARARAGRRALRDGVPAAAEQGQCG